MLNERDVIARLSRRPIEEMPCPRWRNGDVLYYVESSVVDGIIEKFYPEIISIVNRTYTNFYEGLCVNPDTYSLRFPEKPNARINALPSYVGGDVNIAGLKWVGSFPDNVVRNSQRASALIVLNSYESGYPVAILDGTKISAARTVASGVLAANKTIPTKRVSKMSLYGAGIIHRELVFLLLQDGWSVDQIIVNDLDHKSSEAFTNFCSSLSMRASVGTPIDEKTPSDIVSFATSALEPWCDRDVTSHRLVLHMSLRDIAPNQLRKTYNVVDHIPHALKANTSLHLLDQSGVSYHIDDFRFFDRADCDRSKATVVSAFGMGILDVAVAAFILDVAEFEGRLVKISGLRACSKRW